MQPNILALWCDLFCACGVNYYKVQSVYPATVACGGVRPCSSVKQRETILIVTNAININK